MEECLAIKLLTSLFKLMFFPNYSIALKKGAANEPNTKVSIGCNFYCLERDLKRILVPADSRLFWKNFDNTGHPNDQYKFYYNR